MPVYEYLCDDCGPFTDMRPMAECDAPQDCPRCESESPRVILTAPNFFCMPIGQAQGPCHQRAQRQRAQDRRRIQGLARPGLRLLLDARTVAAGEENKKRRQELSDRAAVDDQPLIRLFRD